MGRNKKDKQHIICPICSTPFIPVRARNKYCSQQCQWEGLKKPRTKHICKHCGKEFYTQAWIKGTYCSKECQAKGYTKPKEIREQEQIVKQEARQYKSSIKVLIRTLNKVMCKKQSDIDRTYGCSYCGKPFISVHGSIYCSEECRRKGINLKHDITHKDRLTKNGEADKTITLEKLYQRDKGICKLCGKPTDKKDYAIVNDFFIAGDKYPSIDHIIPIAKGGLHQWNNVQLAHRSCNSTKGTRV